MGPGLESPWRLVFLGEPGTGPAAPAGPDLVSHGASAEPARDRAIEYADFLDFDLVRRLPANAPSVVGTDVVQAHFPTGVTGSATVLIHHPQLDFQVRDGEGQIEISELTDRLMKSDPLATGGHSQLGRSPWASPGPPAKWRAKSMSTNSPGCGNRSWIIMSVMSAP